MSSQIAMFKLDSIRRSLVSTRFGDLKHSPKKTLKKPLYISKSFIFQLSP